MVTGVQTCALRSLLSYSKTFPKDVYLRTEHVVWMPEMLGLARVAAAVNASGLKYQANPAIFKAVHEQKINLADTATFKSWAAAQKSFDSKKLIAAYDAPASLAVVKKMQSLTEIYRIDSTPDVIVGGKYRVIFSSDWAHEQKIIGELMRAELGRRRGLGRGRCRSFFEIWLKKIRPRPRSTRLPKELKSASRF